MAEVKTVSFYGTCAARSVVTLVSKRIQSPFRLRRIQASFPSGCNNLLALRFFMSRDLSAPAAGEPTGTSLLRDYGQVDYVVGEGEQKSMDHGISVAEAGSYLKVYAVNDDFYDHAVDVQMEIEANPE